MISRKPSTKENNIDDFIKGAKDVKTDTIKVKNQELQHPPQDDEIDLNKMRRQTYYITELYIEAIEQMAFYEKMDKSEIVRKALEQYIPKKYIQLSVNR